ncbi:hypothetical protein AVEN_71819-1 [Araneus ventricosus]|uniref:Transposable element Tc3 transposase n=1 Tax=Araneus ventricosus TaxID=182803 RepID=A0A4Y2WZP7_ARAVE|nr:hypothetical protein AVEN_71819-1 [Araneus ventricosus]
MKKKWNLDGSDGNIKYWYGLRKEPRSFFGRQSGGGFVIVWAAFGFNGQVGLAFLDGLQNSPKYIETLLNHLMPFAENIGDEIGNISMIMIPPIPPVLGKIILTRKMLLFLSGHR